VESGAFLMKPGFTTVPLPHFRSPASGETMLACSKEASLVDLEGFDFTFTRETAMN
jgi:hypothetical protein